MSYEKNEILNAALFSLVFLGGLLLAAPKIMKTQKKKKIIWAVDPYAEDSKSQLSVLRMLLAIAPKKNLSIEPVYVAYAFPLIAESAEPDHELKATQAAFQKLLSHADKKMDKKLILPLKRISGVYDSYRELAKVLLNYAKGSHAELIALSTHARKGVNLWFVGSFAESLMRESTIPLLVSNPHWKPSQKIESILFATDFSKASKKAFLEVLSFAKAFEFEVTLYHKLSDVVTQTLTYPLFSYPFYEEVFGRELDEKSKLGEKWIKETKKLGVKVSLHIDREYIDSTAKSVLKLSAKKHSMIALASEEGFLSHLFRGGVSRKVVRASHFPIWVVR